MDFKPLHHKDTPAAPQGKGRRAGGCRVAKCACACLLALTSPVLSPAQEAQDGKQEDDKPLNALEHTLQRPAVTKHFDDRRFSKHIFIDIGGGPNLVGGNGMKAGLQAGGNLGGWITPEHGIRVGASAGLYRLGNATDTKFAGASIDYLLNATALAARHYTKTRPFELYPLAGIDLVYSHKDGKADHGFGLHVGLRGQARLSRSAYLYLEPRVGVLQDQVPQAYTWHRFRPAANVTAGLGYRMPYGEVPRRTADSLALPVRASDGWFVSAAGGATFMVAGTQPSEWRHYSGERLGLSVGKWFGDLNGVRLTGVATCFKQDGMKGVRGLGVQADYLLNLHTLFIGRKPQRRYWLNAIAGASVNFTSSYAGRHTTLGFGAGLQPNIRLSPDVSLFIEPRVDAYGEDYATRRNTEGKLDVTGTLLAGLTWTSRHAYLHRAPDGGEDFTPRTWHDHMFIEGSLGGNIAVIRPAVEHPRSYLRPSISAGVGKWFTPLHGARFWTQMAQTEYDDLHAGRYLHTAVGLDYLFNFSNAVSGYRSCRPLELVGALGVNGAVREKRRGMRFFGMNASFKGIWNLNPLFALYVEPQLRAYGGNFLPGKLRKSDLDFIATVSAGMQFNMHGYSPAAASAVWEGDEGRRSSFSMAGGIALQANHARSSEYYGPMGRISYTHWFTPLSAWRASVQGNTYQYKGRQFAAAAVGADYVTDLTAQTYGYDPSRPLSINALAGFNLGLDYCRQTTHFAPDFHFGGQFVVRLSDALHLFAEPLVAYRMSSRFKDERASRWLASGLLGIDYSFHRAGAGKTEELTPSRRNFVSAALGTGAYTSSVTSFPRFGRKLTFFTDANYGRWIKGFSGVRVGIGNTVVQRNGRGNESITALRADYMMNLRAAVTGENTDSKVFQLTALLGATANISSRVGRDTRTVVGIDGAVQAGWRVTPALELFLEPSAALYGKRIVRSRHNPHPGEGEVRLSIGTKYCF